MAGQYLTLRVPGAGEPAPVRNYSLSSGPTSTNYRISIKREAHGVVSQYLHTTLRPGSLLDVAAPRGEFLLAEDTTPVLLISAGIGVTPVLAMLNHLAAAKSTREVWWIHTARDATQHPFAEEAHQLLQSLPRAHERIFYTSAEADPLPTGTVVRGRPTLAALTRLGLPTDANAYLCGPTQFMDDMRGALAEIGIAPDRLHTELFGALPPLNPGVTDVRHTTPHQPVGPQGSGPEITFARSGLAVRWADRHHSLLELAEACGVPTRYSCRTGVCHTCITPLLTGKVEYAPSPLEMPEAEHALICCARPDGELVLDL
jgi:ferredoxin-NADP reductase